MALSLMPLSRPFHFCRIMNPQKMPSSPFGLTTPATPACCWCAPVSQRNNDNLHPTQTPFFFFFPGVSASAPEATGTNWWRQEWENPTLSEDEWAELAWCEPWLTEARGNQRVSNFWQHTLHSPDHWGSTWLSPDKITVSKRLTYT